MTMIETKKRTCFLILSHAAGSSQEDQLDTAIVGDRDQAVRFARVRAGLFDDDATSENEGMFYGLVIRGPKRVVTIVATEPGIPVF